MIIILNQAQIEEALTNYVNSRLVVQEGMRLDIDLKATRGEAGMTATVEIKPIDAPAAVNIPVETVTAPIARVSAAKTTPAKPAVAKAEPAPDEEAPAAEAEAEPETEAPAEAEAAPQEAANETKRPSIFSNMKTPKGRVGDGDSEAA